MFGKYASEDNTLNYFHFSQISHSCCWLAFLFSAVLTVYRIVSSSSVLLEDGDLEP
jgi:hypothetical protein